MNIIGNLCFLEKTERKDLEGMKIILTWFHRHKTLFCNSLYCNLAYCMQKKNTVMWYICAVVVHKMKNQLKRTTGRAFHDGWSFLMFFFLVCQMCVIWGQIRSWSLLPCIHPHTHIKVQRPAETMTRSSAWVCSHRSWMKLFKLKSYKTTWIYGHLSLYSLGGSTGFKYVL